MSFSSGSGTAVTSAFPAEDSVLMNTLYVSGSSEGTEACGAVSSTAAGSSAVEAASGSEDGSGYSLMFSKSSRVSVTPVMSYSGFLSAKALMLE